MPFALAAGISGAMAETHLVVTAGFAEIAYLLAKQYHKESVILNGPC